MKKLLGHANKKLMVISMLAIIVMIAVAGTTPPSHKNNFKNLKVLPQDISNESLHAIMKEFNDALGVKCNFCHAQKDTSRHLDFASDSNHVKDGARYMMRMTMNINKDYLQVKQPLIGDSTLVVTCYTCHRGSPYPDKKMRDSIPHNDLMPRKDSTPH